MRYAAIVMGMCTGLLLTSAALAETSQPATGRAVGAAKQADSLQQYANEAVPLQQQDAKEAVAEVVVLHGTNDGKGIDPSIGKLPQLKQPPFSSYDSYQLLKRSKLALKGGSTATMELPDKGTFKLSLTDIAKDKRYVLAASIIKPDGKTFLPNMKVNARAGDIFFIAGQKYKNGILVLGIRVRPKP